MYTDVDDVMCVCSDTEKSQAAPTTVNNDTTSSLVSDTRQLPQVCPSVCLVMVCSLSVAWIHLWLKYIHNMQSVNCLKSVRLSVL